MFNSHGYDIKYFRCDKYGACIDSLEEIKPDIILINPNFTVNSNITMPVTRRLEIIKWAKENNVLIIEDDYNGELRYSTHPMPCVQNYDTENTVYLGSFSKILLPSVRISYMVLPPHLAATYQEKLDFYACTVSNFEQYALAAFIEEGYFEKHLNRMRLYYTKQREAVLSVLKEEPFKCVGRVREADSGLHFILELNTLLSDNEVKRKLEADGILSLIHI